ncbi:MAG TPA: ABC transporter ATP-binding protein [Methylomirabilota bacterium]|nr:ABC transporter ATP-binding protein [Methylomirabilota bacterium]
MSKLHLSRLVCRFGSVTAVDDLTLTLETGEFVSLLGPSGCGKTTTLRMIAGFLDPTEGTITMDGEVISSPGSSLPPEKRNMSMIFQSYAIWPNMTVAQNVGFGLEVRRVPRAEARAKVEQILEVVRLGHLRDRYPAELSGGQQQRVALARAIVVQPAVLLLDEPLSNLDANLREEMRYEIRRLHDDFQITTVYVTHDQAEAMVTSDRIAVMNQGRIEQVDEPRALYARPRTRFVAGFIGRTNFLEGEVRGDEVIFDRFAIKRALFAEPEALTGKVAFSLRPQSIHLHRRRPPVAEGTTLVEGDVVQRAYLGEHWDYSVRPRHSALQLRVTARPHEVFEVNEAVWLEIDARQLARLFDVGAPTWPPSPQYSGRPGEAGAPLGHPSSQGGPA